MKVHLRFPLKKLSKKNKGLYLLMAKRTVRDEEMLAKIDAIKVKERKESETEKLEIPLDPLSLEDMTKLVASIEEFTIRQFTSYPKATFFSISAWDGGLLKEADEFRCMSHIFQNCTPYMTWLRGYRILLSQNYSPVYQNFGKDWFAKEIVKFLSAITVAWSKNHSLFEMKQGKEHPFTLTIIKHE